MSGSFHASALSMIFDAGPVVQVVLLILLFFSVVSWAIIFMKLFSFRRVAKENDAFFEGYLRAKKFTDVSAEAKKYDNSTAAEVFRNAYEELSRLSGRSPGEAVGDIRAIDAIERAVGRTISTEAGKLGSFLPFLATTGNACPFIGLFGTVWGIMDTFRGIGLRGSANLAVVAPGISEALIATAMGLAAAIPAVIFFNYFTNRTKAFTLEMEAFASELINIIERNYLR
ncbi:MAG TPA: protein TolQ [Syntrophales bacterium]|nr:protein TolQ [Syntrophales bacterium]HOL58342.1 protein TolQ [Syntrophales bacterium]HPO34511.1 protein TolQ [Syntrophales bacterium]